MQEIAEGCGYATAGRPAASREELAEDIEKLRSCGRAAFIDCRIHKGLSGALPPLKFSHREAIDALIEELQQD